MLQTLTHTQTAHSRRRRCNRCDCCCWFFFAFVQLSHGISIFFRITMFQQQYLFLPTLTIWHYIVFADIGSLFFRGTSLFHFYVHFASRCVTSWVTIVYRRYCFIILSLGLCIHIIIGFVRSVATLASSVWLIIFFLYFSIFIFFLFAHFGGLLYTTAFMFYYSTAITAQFSCNLHRLNCGIHLAHII